MRTRNVLVVDDDPHILEVLEMRLQTMGFNVTAAQEPGEALRAIGERAFDLALVDLRMEPIDGIALMRAAHECQARLPVLIMTAHGTIETAVNAIKEGAFDYLTKPFVPEELRGKITRALSERRWAGGRALLSTVGQTLASSSGTERVLEVVARATLEAAETERAVVFLREDDRLAPKVSAGASPSPIEDLVAVAESAMRKREPLKVTGEGGRIMLAAPLLVDGASQGALVAENPSYVVATEDDLGQLMLFADQAAVALKNAQELARCRSGAITALGRVATQVAHELNNPLGGLKLYVSLLEERLAKADDGDGVEFAAKAARAIDRLAALVRDITAYGRAPELERRPTRLNDLVDECLTLAADRLTEKHLRLMRELDDSLGDMLLDARELQKVVLNLILNGIDAMEDGGTLTVQTRRVDEHTVEIAIEDTGCGMDEETQARMFDLFFTTKPSGTGLGMAIVRSVVDRHGGRLELRSEPGRGTRIRVALPIVTQ